MPVLHAAAVLVLSALGAVLAGRLLGREWQRVNAELDRVRTATVNNAERAGAQTLQRDPATGEYRPRR
jgi:hypothetical protein